MADPDSNWTYVIIAVDGTAQELVRSNGYADHDFDMTGTPWADCGQVRARSRD